MTDEREAATGRYRPKKGKGHNLSARITAETRAALLEEAERTGRSISLVAEMWLEEARQGRAKLEDLLGGLEIASAIKAMAEAARAVQERFGPPSTSPAARAALLGAWVHLSRSMVPHPPPSEEEIAWMEAMDETITAALELADAGIKTSVLDRHIIGLFQFEIDHRPPTGGPALSEMEGSERVISVIEHFADDAPALAAAIPLGTPFPRNEDERDYRPLTERERAMIVQYLHAERTTMHAKDKAKESLHRAEAVGRHFASVYRHRDRLWHTGEYDLQETAEDLYGPPSVTEDMRSTARFHHNMKLRVAASGAKPRVPKP